MKFGYLTLGVALIAGCPRTHTRQRSRMAGVSPMPAHTMRNSSPRTRRLKSS